MELGIENIGALSRGRRVAPVRPVHACIPGGTRSFFSAHNFKSSQRARSDTEKGKISERGKLATFRGLGGQRVPSVRSEGEVILLSHPASQAVKTRLSPPFTWQALHTSTCRRRLNEDSPGITQLLGSRAIVLSTYPPARSAMHEKMALPRHTNSAPLLPSQIRRISQSHSFSPQGKAAYCSSPSG